ncbi:MAG: pitrilysin family protein [Candidatus Pacearchaeota archaeon]
MAEFKREVLSNGVILLHEKRTLPVTSVAIACKVGSINENKSIKGVSHFVEHTTFKGTTKRDQKQIKSEIEGVGGDFNAFTDHETTAYHAKVPSRHFDKAFDVLADMVQNAVFPELEIEKEKKVILEEIKMIYDDPKRFLFEKVFESLYSGDFGLPIIGTKESVSSLSREKMLKWYNNYYQSKNFIVSVVGKNEFEEVKKVVEEKISFRSNPKINNLKTKKRIKDFVETRKQIEQAHLGFAFHLPNGFSEYRYAAEVANALLGFGMSSWLFQEIREKRALAYATKSILDLGRNFGYLLIYVGTDKNKITEVETVTNELIRRLKEIDTKDLEEPKEQLIGNWELARENSLLTCIDLIGYELINKIEDYYRYDEKISAVNATHIKELFKETIGLAKVFILPRK